MQHVDFSLVICTYNRGDVLSDTLRSYAEMRDFECQVELVVVDNNSTDQTRQIVNAFTQKHQNLAVRYLFEPQPGLSYARNTGIRESQGEIIGFVDDDVYFDPYWLKETWRAFQEHAEASCMGGRSIPRFETGQPDWVTEELLVYYGSTNSGDVAKFMVYPEYPFGLNMAFRRNVFGEIGMFNPNLGRKGKNLLSDEEKDIFYRVAYAGLKVIYTPHALLFHRIPETRARKEWILSRSYWQGVSSVTFEQIVAPRSRLVLLGQAMQCLWKIVRQVSGGHWSPRKIFWHHEKTKFSVLADRAYQRGLAKQMVAEAFRLRRT